MHASGYGVDNTELQPEKQICCKKSQALTNTFSDSPQISQFLYEKIPINFTCCLWFEISVYASKISFRSQYDAIWKPNLVSSACEALSVYSPSH